MDTMGLVPTIIFGAILFWSLRAFRQTMRLRHIPTAGGPSFPVLSYIGALRGLVNDKQIIAEGYAKYKGSPFKIATMSSWSVIVSGPQLVDELRKAGDDEMSLSRAMGQVLQIEHTLGHHPDDSYHTNVIRTQLKNNLDSIFPTMYDEVSAAFNDNVLLTEDWASYPVFELAREIVARTNSRIFVGLPLCRDKDYIALNKQYPIDVVVRGLIIRSFPSEIRHIAGKLFSAFPSYLRSATKLLGPTIQERLNFLAERGPKWEGRPNDMLQWLIDGAPCDEKLTIPQLVTHIMHVNNTSILTSAATFSQALLHLAAYPQYIKPLREEVEAVLKGHGWTRKALAEMHKLDSFYRETQRIAGIGNTHVFRVAMKDYTFSDGTFIPEGTFIAVASKEMHMDGNTYPSAQEFSPFRFSDMRERDQDSDTMTPKFTMVSLGVNHVPFGHGKHACPGRFWAATELKAMLAYVLTEFDVRAEKENVPAPRSFSNAARTMHVLLRRRRM